MKNIVVIGGGTGTYIVLTGLKEYPVNLSAIVAMSDSGGSTGILRDELGVLPPGDIRRALVALSQSPQIIRDLFNYRFENGGLGGHSFGNLFLTALEKITGDFEKAVEEAGKILSIRGQIIPVTKDSVHLHAVLENGEEVAGETNIDIPKHDGKLKIKKVFLRPRARATKGALKAIEKADLIVIGPGDLYTSLIPNLLVKGISSAIIKSRAKLVYVCGLMTKYGETYGFKADDFAKTVESYLGKRRIDYIVVNNTVAPKKILARYSKEKKEIVPLPLKNIKRHYKVIQADVASTKQYFRHDSHKLAKVLIMLTEFENVLSFLETEKS